MTESVTEPIRYAEHLLNADRRVAVLAVGQQKGLWIFHAQVDGRYLVEREGVPRYLTDSEVDRLLFDHFVEP